MFGCSNAAPIAPPVVAKERVDGSALDAASSGSGAIGDAASDAASSGSNMDAGDCAEVMRSLLLTCGSIVCHDPFSGGIGLQLDLSSAADLPASLIGTPSSADCDAIPYIDSDEPDRSLLLRKLEDDPPCGDRMPAGDRPPLDAVQRECLTTWVIEAAAGP